MNEQTALVVADAHSSVELMPASMGKTFTAYRQLQGEIDKSMPDQIMTIQGRQFRKKGYWRAVRAAFGLRVECVREERIDRGGDWGYSVLYRASAKNGATADGDGVCMSTEKRGGQGTEHNVRSHAHTRAFNRAVSNLVGFGEVSAEEVERDEAEHHVHAAKPLSHPSVIDTTPEPPEMGPDHDLATAALDGVIVTKVRKLKSGSNARGEWSMYAIGFSDGTEGVTFDTTIALNAETYMADKSIVAPVLTPNPNGKGMNLTSLLRVL